ncbi:helix-hairpin-helix domain-containing protein [Chryseobacterium chendengshani]|uniref:helix-hairpin-helix domain-containing protein n=1 Tax=Chryseobacterium sp. LJ668 TaxID=2864040 RepID=UPI001C69162E|nr:helix-hairpin-helix domain-containing protein [Chryseobacterium sp. LJ668]MBW8523435.1 helix-hairpin-helix domain-containing protein [Chryseobacterium sp. LJ668]QYK18133.1 helix-hairpin-helix domain-containing protein [Chryseobacterium sp. LJ668]
MKKNYYQKLAILGMLLLILLAFQKYTEKSDNSFPTVTFISESLPLESLSEFDPNDLDENQWQKLGFSEKQTTTILKYKKIVGGKFLSKEQFKKCYAISEEKFSQLETFLLLPETNSDAKPENLAFKNYEKKSLNITKKFNPDQLSQNDWEKMGFSEKQAAAILKYKSYLGGSFVSKEKFKECFIISEKNYATLQPYLLLPAKTPDNFNSYAGKSHSFKSKAPQTSFDPNTLDVNGWMALGFSEKQANVIVNYRDRNLKGSFKTLEDIKNCFVISAEKFEELKPFIRLNSSTMAKNSADKKPEPKQEKTDFSKVDMNSITFKQLIEFGLDEKSAGSMIGFRKKLGGFMTKEQILETYNIDKELVQKLLAIAPLDNSKVERYSLVDAPEEWLKNHPYFKYSADKIIFYRLSNPDDKKIWKFLKTKPEYEARMRLYIK